MTRKEAAVASYEADVATNSAMLTVSVVVVEVRLVGGQDEV